MTLIAPDRDRSQRPAPSRGVSAAARCRGCGGPELRTVLSLGCQPLANALLTGAQLSAPEPRYPLELALCSRCALVQLRESVPPEAMFSEYLYFSSCSESWLAHARRLADRLIDERRLGPRSLVLEIASNDGYLLKRFVERGVPVLGVDPARNVAAAAEAAGVPTRCEFFTAEFAGRLSHEGTRPDVIIANNVLAHVPDPAGLLAGAARLLRPGGTVEIEVPYVRDLIDKTEFDTIYHEHLCYFSLTALRPMFASAGLSLRQVRRLPTHGGSLHLSAARDAESDGSAETLLAEERAAGLHEPAYYARFAGRVERLGAGLLGLLRSRRAAGRRIAAYGAAAKGTVLLNHFRIGPDLVEFVVDRSPAKQGRYVPGVRLPILPVETLLERRPDDCLLLAWNLADEIIAQQAAYRAAGGCFIVPLPEPRTC